MGTQQVQDDNEINIGQLIGILLSGKWIIFACVFIALFFAYVHLKLATPIYVAKALLQVEQKQGGLGGFGDLDALMGGETKSSVEVKVLQSRFVLGEVVKQQNLQLRVVPKYLPFVGEYIVRKFEAANPDDLSNVKFGLNSYSWGGERVSVSQFYIDDGYAPNGYVLRVKSGSEFELLNRAGALISGGKVGVPLSVGDGQLVFTVSELVANAGAEFSVAVSRYVDASNRLKSGLVVSEQGRQTGVIELSIEGEHKDYLKTVLNGVVDTYHRLNVQRFSEEAERSITFLESQIPNVRGQLELAEQKLNEYRVENGSLDMGIETKAVLDQILSFDRQISQLELKESEISSRYQQDHPVYSTLLEQKGRLQLEKQRIEESVGMLPDTQQQLLRLNRDVEVTAQVYLQLLNKMEELKVIRAGTVGNIRILEPAEVMTYPIKPKKPITMVLAFMVGSFVSLVIIFAIRILNPGITNPALVQEQLGIANYGVVPVSDVQSVSLKKGGGSSKVLAALDPKDLSLEAIRGTRTSLHFAMMEAKDNVVMLTGPSPGVGKSFISTNLAALIGDSGQRVLLVDADMRRGHINKSFGLTRNNGLSDLLSKNLALEDVTHQSVLINVDFISTGEIPPNPSELLMSERFAAFLVQASGLYDVVLIDTPPVLAVTDAMIVGKQVGTTMVVVKHQENTMREVQQMKTEADKLGVVIKGYIYNFMNYRDSQYSYGVNKYYNYGYYGMADEEKSSK